MKRKRSLELVVVLLIGIGLGLALKRWLGRHAEHRYRTVGKRSAVVAKSTPAPVKVQPPVRRDFQLSLPWAGRVESCTVVEVVALQAGRVESVKVADESAVSLGQPLFTIGGPQIAAAKASTQSNIETLSTRLKLAQQTVERKHGSLKMKLSTQDKVAEAQSKVAEIEGELRAARQDAKSLDDRTRITATAAGIFTRRRVNVGQDVKAGQVLGEIVDPSHLRVVATVFPSQGIPLKGHTARIALPDSHSIVCAVTKVLPQRTATGGTVVWIEGEAIDRSLHPGEFVTGDITVQTHPEAIAVPETAIVYDENETPYLFVRGPHGFQKRPVRTGAQADGWVEVLGGIRDDEPVVTQGAYELFYRDFNKYYKVPD